MWATRRLFKVFCCLLLIIILECKERNFMRQWTPLKFIRFLMSKKHIIFSFFFFPITYRWRVSKGGWSEKRIGTAATERNSCKEETRSECFYVHVYTFNSIYRPLYAFIGHLKIYKIGNNTHHYSVSPYALCMPKILHAT